MPARCPPQRLEPLRRRNACAIAIRMRRAREIRDETAGRSPGSQAMHEDRASAGSPSRVAQWHLIRFGLLTVAGAAPELSSAIDGRSQASRTGFPFHPARRYRQARAPAAARSVGARAAARQVGFQSRSVACARRRVRRRRRPRARLRSDGSTPRSPRRSAAIRPRVDLRLVAFAAVRAIDRDRARASRRLLHGRNRRPDR